MGAALSCLALPALGSLGSCAASCCSAAACSLVCQSCHSNHAILTRSLYVLILFLNTLIAWVMMSDWATEKLASVMPSYLAILCEGEHCDSLAAHKVGLSSVLFHTLLGLLVLGVRDSRDQRAVIQNGGWGIKLALWLTLVVACLFIPNEFFFVWPYICLIGAVLFILFGFLLLLDLSQAWTELCLDRLLMSDNDRWQYLLIGHTLSHFGGAIALTGLLYSIYKSLYCKVFTSINLALSVITTIMCILPAVQDTSSQSGLFHASVTVLYSTLQVFSAIVYEPTKYSSGPEDASEVATGFQKSYIIIELLVASLVLIYAASRSAPTEDYQQVGGKGGTNRDYSMASTHHGEIARYGPREEEEEANGTVYNYSFFHLLLAMATMYITLSMTQWNMIEVLPSQSIHMIHTQLEVWAKVVCSWMAFGLYIWILLAPLFMPGEYLE